MQLSRTSWRPSSYSYFGAHSEAYQPRMTSGPLPPLTAGLSPTTDKWRAVFCSHGSWHDLLSLVFSLWKKSLHETCLLWQSALLSNRWRVATSLAAEHILNYSVHCYLPNVLCLPFYTTLCIAQLFSRRCISTVRSYPWSTVRFVSSCSDLYLDLFFYATLQHTSIFLLLQFYSISKIA